MDRQRIYVMGWSNGGFFGQLYAIARHCKLGRGLLNHVRWPDGVADRSGLDHEPQMLDFLRRHALSNPRSPANE